MATYKVSNIRLYSASTSNNWELLPHKLFVVDSIEDYLATKTYVALSNIQYQKPQLELSITLDFSQTYAEPLNQSFKYVRIENSDQTGQYYYYFVKNVIWRSKSAVRFDLVMDVLNTFKEGTHYSFKDSTKVTREHKDRFFEYGLLINIDFDMQAYGGTIDIDNNILMEDNSGTTILEGTVTYITEDTISISVRLNYSREDIEEGIDNAELPIIIKKDNANYLDVYITSYSFDSSLYRTIDYVPENINPTLQCGNAAGTTVANNKTMLQGDWYLLYRNQNDPDPSQYVNPVDCYLIPKNSTEVSIGVVSNGRVTPATLETGKYYYVSVNNASGVTLSNGITLNNSYGPAYLSGKYIEIFKNNDETLTVTFFARVTTLSQDPYFETYNVDYVTLNTLPTDYVSYTTRPEQSAIINGWSGLVKSQWTSSSVGVYLDPVEDIDRTDSKNIKLIKLPYCPFDFDITSNKIDITGSNWNYVDLVQADSSHIKVLKLNNLNTELHTEMYTTGTANPYNRLYVNTLSYINPQNTDLRKGANYESKLYNSEFYRPTFYYDSFQFVFQLEKLNALYYVDDYSKCYIDFDVTRTINSRFMFTFTNYVTKMANENYAKYMPIARNNEEVLYNVPYINYVRTGYNYDIKAKNISNQSTWIGVAASGVGLAASFVMPSAPLKALGVVTSLISMAMTVKNAVVTTVQNEESINRKLQEAKMQTASVSGSDDVDLLSVYSNNRLKYLTYEPNEVMKNMLYNLFFFAGYNSQRMGLPNHNTRLNFDYLECDAVIDKIANIPDDCLSELINAFKNGVTYIHKTTRATNKWDFEQKYENWEKSLGVN